jgi:hypothetical protein
MAKKNILKIGYTMHSVLARAKVMTLEIFDRRLSIDLQNVWI